MKTLVKKKNFTWDKGLFILKFVLTIYDILFFSDKFLKKDPLAVIYYVLWKH